MSDYEATAYLSLEKLKVNYYHELIIECRKNICWSFNNSRIKSEMN